MRRRLRAAFSLAISLAMVLPPPTLVSPGIFLDMFRFNTRTMSRTVSAALQSGAPSLDAMRGTVPQAPPAYQMTGSLPPAGYDDPRPSLASNFDAYLTELTKERNATGVAGSKPMQSADPTAGRASVGGWSYNLDSQNYNFTAPVLTLPGRAGMNLSLALSHNSRVWTKSGGTMVFNADRGFPAPGWRFGFGEILIKSQASPAYNNGVTGRPSVIFIAPDGTRRDLALNGEGTAYVAYDSSYLKFDLASRVLSFPDGTQAGFGAESTANGDARYLTTWIRDRNGNRIDVFHATLSNGIVAPSYVIDTAGRRIDFNYQNDRLTSITQNRGGNAHAFASLDYQAVTIQTNFNYGEMALDPPAIDGTTVYLPVRITYPTGINYRFSYTDYGQIASIEKWVPGIAGQGGERKVASTSFDLPWSAPLVYPAQGDCPIFDQRTEWAENWQGGIPATYGYYYWIEGGHRVYDPLYNQYRIYRNGMTHEQAITANGASEYTKMTRLTYASDSGPSYIANPRVAQSEEYAKVSGGVQIKKSTVQYLQRDGMWLPSIKDDLTPSGAIYRRTVTDYTSYPAQYILGLPQQVSVSDGAGTLLSRVANNYDQTGSYVDSNGQQAPYFIDAAAEGVIQHDSGYNGGFTARGNPTSVVQYSVSGGAVNGSRVVKRTSYDTNGNVRAQADAAANRSQFILGDYCANKPAGIGQTHVQPQAARNPIGFGTGSQWDYYTGLTVKTFNLTPGSGVERQIVTTSHDFAGRPQVTTRPDGGWLRTDYWDNWLAAATTQLVDAGKMRARFEIYDGAGRVIRKATDHPDGSPGTYSGQIVVLDKLGETEDSSNVIAINSSWTPILDDAPGGFLFTHLTRDELGRLKIVTRPDNNTVTYAYDGCGCAGNSQTRITDELGHYTTTKTDFLGRLVEAAEPAESQPFHSRAIYVHDELDRLVRIEHSDYSGKTQTRTFSYDGYGRLATENTPEGCLVRYA